MDLGLYYKRIITFVSHIKIYSNFAHFTFHYIHIHHKIFTYEYKSAQNASHAAIRVVTQPQLIELNCTKRRGNLGEMR